MPTLPEITEQAAEVIGSFFEDVDVVSALLNQVEWSDKKLHNVVDIGWQTSRFPGIFFVRAIADNAWQQRAVDNITYQRCAIEQIYAGATDDTVCQNIYTPPEEPPPRAGGPQGLPTAPPPTSSPPTQPPLPVPPPTIAGVYRWDAKTAPLDPHSASLIAAWLSYAFVHGSELACNYGLGIADASSPGYHIPAQHANCVIDANVYIPLGTLPGFSSDHHLSILDPVHKREHHFWLATYDPSTRRITGCRAGNSGPLGEFTQGPCSSNASDIPQTRCGILPSEVAAGVIPHALMFSMPNPGPAPNRYPATSTVGYPNNTGFPLGTWIALDPAVNVAGLGLATWERVIAKALQDYGAFCTDQGSMMNIKGLYPTTGATAGYDAWHAAGVTLTSGGTATNKPWAKGFSQAFHDGVYKHMRVLQPPPKP